jgi:hypothetical protein
VPWRRSSAASWHSRNGLTAACARPAPS